MKKSDLQQEVIAANATNFAGNHHKVLRRRLASEVHTDKFNKSTKPGRCAILDLVDNSLTIDKLN